jgi:ADP-heptose:LPS heptosyltransferase
MSSEIIIIKLGAKGDVVRTMSVLPAIKKKFPSSIITWVTKSDSKEILQNNPYIKKVLGIKELKKFDDYGVLYCLDLEEEASSLALKIKAEKKLGFYMDGGYPAAFNPGAQYYIDTVFDDELKVSNDKSVQEMMFEACELEYNKDFCPIILTDKERDYASKFLKEHGYSSGKIVGIHIGASARWPSKTWSDSKFLEFIKSCRGSGYSMLVFGGPLEADKLKKLKSEMDKAGERIMINDPSNTDREFFSLVNACSVMVTPDSYALHVSLALRKPTIGLFFCTSPKEIEGYGLLTKIVSQKLYDFFPGRQDEYDQDLVNSISVSSVIMEVKRLLHPSA